jgi:hypothetical protein
MAMTLKNKSLPTLGGYSCDANGIATLKSLGVAEQKGGDFYTLWHGLKGYKLKINWLLGTFNAIRIDLNSFMLLVLSEIELEKKGEGAASPVHSSAKEPVASVVPLRDADAMYQRVIGTSQGSVYVVVAMADGLRIAAKTDMVSGLSVRAEGAALNKTAITNALMGQGLTLKSKGGFNYMSGHYTGTDEAPAHKILGAILMGSGIEFFTPFPKFNKVKDGSK